MMYLAAISACHVGFGSAPIGQNSLIRRFMKGGHQLRSPAKPVFPLCDLLTVLEALLELPFEPLECLYLKELSLETLLLLSS